MATAWKVATAIAVVGWFVRPVISFFMPKILACFGLGDASQKLRHLELNILRVLEETLPAVDEARMLERGNISKSEVTRLDKMAAMLRHAREEAEDILDAKEDIELYLYRNKCWQRVWKTCVLTRELIAGIFQSRLSWLLQWVPNWFRKPIQVNEDQATSHNQQVQVSGTVGASDEQAVQVMIPSASVVVVANIQSISARLLQWVQNWFKEPGLGNEDQETSHEGDPVNVSAATSARHVVDIPVVPHTDSASNQQALFPMASNPQSVVPVAPPHTDSDSVQVTTPSGASFHILTNRCRSIICWLLGAYNKACLHRDLSYKGAGITSNQDAFDCVLTAISRRNLKKRIEEVESTVNEVKKSSSHMVDKQPQLSKTENEEKKLAVSTVQTNKTPDVIVNKNRRKIRTASKQKVFGREALRDSIMAKLREMPSSSTTTCYSAIGIYGIAGSGKTTLARYTRDYIMEECKEKLFDAVMCIHVSENFSVKKIFQNMLKDITNDMHSNISDLEELEDKLKESLCGKRFFLIMDDVCVKAKNDPELEVLISPLNVGLKGSKILVTARTEVAAGVLCVDKPMKIPDLDEHEYSSMFMNYALGDTSVIDEEFRRVGRVIAKKLHRSPIAAAIVAGQLGVNRDIDTWENVATLDMLNDTMDALWWSYQQLNPDIRRCFEYCNIFPRGYDLRMCELVRLWMAQGFVNTRSEREDIEDVAERYVRDLVSWSFLQPEKTSRGDDCFRIHDLLHDLLDNIAGSDFFRIRNERNQRGEGWQGDVPRDIRHLFVQNYDAELITERILGLKNLRTLIIYVVENDTLVEENIIESICKRLDKLRVLAIPLSNKDFGIKNISKKFSLPESIGRLKHLRYFAFRTNCNCTVILPNGLTKLHHIQMLDFGGGKMSEFCSTGFTKLRYMICRSLDELPNIGRLISLQTLTYFRVRNEQGYDAKQLRNLNKLRGILNLMGLKELKSKEEALEANLAAKKRLTMLTLRWDPGHGTRCNPEVEADVLDGLCPSARLQKLQIRDYNGSRYPYWMMGKQNGSPKDLRELFLWNWGKVGGLAPEFVETFPFLRVLSILFCSLDALPGNMEQLTLLEELSINGCTHIRSLPILPQSLKMLDLGFCNDEFTNACQTVGHPNWKKIEHIPYKSF